MSSFERERRVCSHCKREFFVRTIRLQEAKTLSCMFCGKRFATKEGAR